MSEQRHKFRDFGLLPEDLQEPKGTIRSFLSTSSALGEYIGSIVVGLVGVGAMVLFVLTLPFPFSVLAGIAALMGFGAIIYLVTHNDFRWVELDGNTLRAKHLYTGRVVERSVTEIEALWTLINRGRHPSGVVVEKLFGRVRGIWIRFRDGRTPMQIMRNSPKMVNAEELIKAVLYRMMQVGELHTDVVQFAGQPMVSCVCWEGKKPAIPSSKNTTLKLGVIALLTAGAVLGYMAVQKQSIESVISMPANKMKLETLVQNGPGTNRHVTITDFRAGGYATETTKSSQRMLVALFPDSATGTRIESVLLVNNADPAALRGILQGGQVTGICSKTPQSRLGTAIIEKLKEVNARSSFSSAWVIEVVTNPPSAAAVQGSFAGSIACFSLVIILAVVVFWRAIRVQALKSS